MSRHQPPENRNDTPALVQLPNFPSHDTVLDRHNLGVVRPRKLTPLEGLPKPSQVRIEDAQSRQNRPLHLSVNYSGHRAWKQTLDPIVQSDRREPADNQRELRKATFIVADSNEFIETSQDMNELVSP